MNTWYRKGLIRLTGTFKLKFHDARPAKHLCRAPFERVPVDRLRASNLNLNLNLNLNFNLTPMTISPLLALETSRVLLRPLQMDDTTALHALAAADPDMWAYFTVNLADLNIMKWWVDASVKERISGSRIPFTIIDKSTNRVAGSMSYLNISYYDQRLEIGSSWLGPEFRSTGINKHSKYIMMNYAFEQMNFERVEYKTDVMNDRARQGLKNIGGTEEGILRSHMKMWNDRRRTSIFYSVLKEEWPVLKQTIFAGIA